MIAWIGLALATEAYAPDSFTELTGEVLYTQDGATQIWSAIEAHSDPDRTLFAQESFNDATAWPVESEVHPWIDDAFGTTTPGSWQFLLHRGLDEDQSSGTPILLVPGAGDSASRAFVTLAARLAAGGRPVYALTFAHPHGDVFMQAEAVANALRRVRARTGADQVDLLGHSKGGVAVAVYLSHAEGTTWPSEAYAKVGTPYAGDVRRAVFVASPLGGLDTSYRWPNASYLALDADTAPAPSAWRTWYPYGVALAHLGEDLSAQDLLPDGVDDLFPGHRQLLARQDHDLPGEIPELGAYSVQQDWYTTYEGGYGFATYSDGIDAAVEAGGSLVEVLTERGVDPGVELYVLAGENPIMPSELDGWLEASFEGFTELATWDRWNSLVADLAERLDGLEVTDEELEGLASGDLALGEVSGPSDGLVFLDSATATDALTARGARVVEVATRDLSHIDLLYASPVTGGLLIELADQDDDASWARALGERYTAEDSLGWIEAVLADDEEGLPDTGGPGDTSSPTTTRGSEGFDDEVRPCGCASGAPRSVWLVVVPLLALRRRSGL